MSYSMPSSTRAAGAGSHLGERASAVARRLRRPELLLLLGLAAILNFWALSRNGFANDYYAAAVRSMASSWHDFLYASMDKAGLMSVDKPPLSLWVEALSVRAFGYSSLSMLVPQALMGIASVGLVYDLVRRCFGRLAGFIGGLALALTPIAVAVSRHNNPDALLVLCTVAALWCTVRGLTDPRARTRWLVLAGVCVGLGFETKMLVALVVVPGIAAAWLWCTPAGRGRLGALRQLLVGGAAMVVVGGAWPALVELTPASQRPWVSGTSDNTVLSLIFGYNGLGRVEGQAGGPGGMGGGGGNTFGGSAGPLRLLNSALGGQASWLLGFALVGGLAILLATRLRRSERRTGWLLAVGGGGIVTAVLFSFAGGIFHPYYVSLLAPFVAALVGAGAAQLIDTKAPRGRRALAAGAVVAGVACELVVLSRYPGQLEWLVPVLAVIGAAAALVLLAGLGGARGRRAAILGALAALAVAPATWAFDTLGYATSGTFPSGGPQNVATAGGGGFGGRGGFPGQGRGGTLAGLNLFGPGGSSGSGGSSGAGSEGPPSGEGPPAGGFGGPGAGGLAGGGGPGGFGDGASLKAVAAYVSSHGGGTVAVGSQSSAASAIVSGDLNVAGIGGFSGRESDVTVSWLAQEVASGKIRWILGEGSQGGGSSRGGLPGDTRTGSRKAVAAAESVCKSVTVSSSSGESSTKLYDCQGRAAALASYAARAERA